MNPECDYLATELMGWYHFEHQTWHEIYYDDNLGCETSRFVMNYKNWNPIKSADDCRACESKIGEMGLGEHYAAILFRPIHTEHCTMTMDEKKDTAKTSAKLLYDYLTLPLETRVDAMIKVVKNWHLAENKMWTGEEGDNEPA